MPLTIKIALVYARNQEKESLNFLEGRDQTVVQLCPVPHPRRNRGRMYLNTTYKGCRLWSLQWRLDGLIERCGFCTDVAYISLNGCYEVVRILEPCWQCSCPSLRICKGSSHHGTNSRARHSMHCLRDTSLHDGYMRNEIEFEAPYQ
jgi:hypothetical protein